MIEVVSGVLATDLGVLIAERAGDRDYTGCWELPGGKVDPGETPEEALIREWKEELGISVRVLRPLGSACFPLRTGLVHVRFFLLSRVREDEIQLDPAVHSRLAFWLPGGPLLPFNPATAHFLNRLWEELDRRIEEDRRIENRRVEERESIPG